METTGDSNYDTGTVTNSYSTSSILYNYYSNSNWYQEEATQYLKTDFTSNTSTPGATLVGTGDFVAGNNSMNMGYLILSWETKEPLK